MENKTKLRLVAKELCQHLFDKELKSIQVLGNLKPLLANCKNIAVYNAQGSEMSLLPVIEYCTNNKKNVYYPIAYKSTKIMNFELHNKHLEQNVFYPDEYKLSNESKWQYFDLILLPLLAVDRSGARLGKGGGYYDYTLQGIKQLASRPLLVGVGFDCQMLDEQIIIDEWDIYLDYFVSECGLIKF